MDLDSLLEYKALGELYKRGGYGLLDVIIRDPDTAEHFKLKKLQFDVAPVLFDDVESVCQLLDMSKREFLTAATMDALKRAHKTIDQRGVIPDEDEVN